MLTAIYKRADAGVILDSSYRIRKIVYWPGGHNAANMHEFTLYNDGTKAIMLTVSDQHLRGPNIRKLGHKGDCLVKTDGLIELDITTTPPTTLFNWSFVNHVSVDETTYPTQLNVDKECRDGWDAHHCNSIDRFENGDYLVSCRHTDALYKISRESGTILWRLGGTRSDFKFSKDAKFSRQHHARIVEQNETHTLISLFDNARAEGINTATHDYTRGLILSLHDGSAEVVAEYRHPDHKWSTSRGSLEILPNSNVFIGWTFHSRISEHAPDGKLLMKAKLPPKKNTYRTYKSAWVGQPIDPPDVWTRSESRDIRRRTRLARRAHPVRLRPLFQRRRGPARHAALRSTQTQRNGRWSLGRNKIILAETNHTSIRWWFFDLLYSCNILVDMSLFKRQDPEEAGYARICEA